MLDGGFNRVKVTPSPEVSAAQGCRSTSPGDYERVVDAQGSESFYHVVDGIERQFWSARNSPGSVSIS